MGTCVTLSRRVAGVGLTLIPVDDTLQWSTCGIHCGNNSEEEELSSFTVRINLLPRYGKESC